MNILGVNAHHADSAACLLKNGKLVAAVEEERFRRIKHWAGFPAQSIKYCLEEGKLHINDLDYIAVNQDTQKNRLKKTQWLIKNKPAFKLIFERINVRRKRASILDSLEEEFDVLKDQQKVINVEHHLAHLYSTFYVSPFQKSALLSIDGFGDFVSTAWGIGENNNVHIEKKIYFPHSLGIFYQAVTQFLGFPSYGDEYKIMGLAPYGDDKFKNNMEKIVSIHSGSIRLNLNYFRHDKDHISFAWKNGEPKFKPLFDRNQFENEFGAQRKQDGELTKLHMDIARSAQAHYERILLQLLEEIHRSSNIENISLAGGCAMNSVANGKIKTHSKFKKIYIQPAAGDAGGALGAALAAYNTADKNPQRFEMKHAYWGPRYDESKILSLVRGTDKLRQDKAFKIINYKVEDVLIRFISKKIQAGKVVGWFQDRMEWGPRALGNRSILCDPRREDIKDILNDKIKRRESFRPFAPAIMRESVEDWFEEDDDVPFMMQVYKIRKDKRAKVPGITHIDGTGRLQTVTIETNRKYYKLIKEFGKDTGVPILLNTSFNENEPIVCAPEEALDCFMRTNMDILVMEQTVVTRN